MIVNCNGEFKIGSNDSLGQPRHRLVLPHDTRATSSTQLSSGGDVALDELIVENEAMFVELLNFRKREAEAQAQMQQLHLENDKLVSDAALVDGELHYLRSTAAERDKSVEELEGKVAFLTSEVEDQKEQRLILATRVDELQLNTLQTSSLTSAANEELKVLKQRVSEQIIAAKFIQSKTIVLVKALSDLKVEAHVLVSSNSSPAAADELTKKAHEIASQKPKWEATLKQISEKANSVDTGGQLLVQTLIHGLQTLQAFTEDQVKIAAPLTASSGSSVVLHRKGLGIYNNGK